MTVHGTHPCRAARALGLIVVLSLFVGTAHAQPLLGAYYGNEGWKMVQVQAMESWQGKRQAVVNLFTNWCNNSHGMDNLFNQQLANVWSNKNVPFVTWEPFLCNSTPTNIDVAIARGDYDAYIDAWAGRMKTFLSGPDGIYGNDDDRRVYVRLAHEMNGNWYPWAAAGAANTPNDYVAMWKRVTSRFAAIGLTSTRLQWIWCVNNDDVGGYAAEQFYPGDAYVDWVAIDGYNWGTSQTWSTWKSPAETFGTMQSRIWSLTGKPLALTEVASTSAGGGLVGKNQWIADLFSYSTLCNVRMVVWFNADKETDWAAFGGTGGDGSYSYGKPSVGYKDYSAYKAAVTATTLTTVDPTRPRLLTDLQFAGQ